MKNNVCCPPQHRRNKMCVGAQRMHCFKLLINVRHQHQQLLITKEESPLFSYNYFWHGSPGRVSRLRLAAQCDNNPRLPAILNVWRKGGLGGREVAIRNTCHDNCIVNSRHPLFFAWLQKYIFQAGRAMKGYIKFSEIIVWKKVLFLSK